MAQGAERRWTSSIPREPRVGERRRAAHTGGGPSVRIAGLVFYRMNLNSALCSELSLSLTFNSRHVPVHALSVFQTYVYVPIDVLPCRERAVFQAAQESHDRPEHQEVDRRRDHDGRRVVCKLPASAEDSVRRR